MSIGIFFNQKDPAQWYAKLTQRLPQANIYVHPDIPEPNDITFALCWKPGKNILKQFPNITAIQSVGAGARHITDTQALGDHQQVSRIVDDNLSNDMFEYSLTALLSQMKNFNTYQNDKIKRRWNRQEYQTIKETAVGILGLGQIGSVVAQKLAGLGFKVSGWSRSQKERLDIENYFGENGLNKVLASSDFIINILPLTNKTKNLIDYTFLKQMKPGAYLVNIGRGQQLVEADLIKVIKEGHLSGATLDVFQVEPLEGNHPFWDFPQITITPHIASITNIESASDLVIENYHRHLRGEKLLHLVQ